MKRINGKVIADFRAGGEIGVGGMHRERLVLLTTRGRTSGDRVTVPLMRIPWEDGVLVVASNNGAAVSPDWYSNIRVDPRVHVEAPYAEWDGTAAILDGDERAEAWTATLEAAPFFAEHEQTAGRALPLVALPLVALRPA